ncbi:hypothetical protein [Streptomyces stelliscabiei]|uniref:hypothetical protein n=1 Tax=Streptomyces stelliscabiei TaxID=146820 RepID=UPI0029A4D674|nr:hypothetical protein [Streptomyces stelliscabiei]MDX2667406.1 hypothetical protein [Streptomyces stelliscabiei]MDX2785945.1 hypothetical protein [Streptomyces stelliscabiei]
MIHRPVLIAEIRELPPEDGWTCHESTRRACVVCTCGLNTGFTDRAEATAVFKAHPVTPQHQAEPDNVPPGLRATLTNAVSDVLDEYPEHNTHDEHAAAVSEVVTAVLRVIPRER